MQIYGHFSNGKVFRKDFFLLCEPTRVEIACPHTRCRMYGLSTQSAVMCDSTAPASGGSVNTSFP